MKALSGLPMKIYISRSPYTIPASSLSPSVKEKLNFIVTQGIIAPVGDNPSPWCPPLVAVAKSTVGCVSLPSCRIITARCPVQPSLHPCPSHPYGEWTRRHGISQGWTLSADSGRFCCQRKVKQSTLSSRLTADIPISVLLSPHWIPCLCLWRPLLSPR